MRKKKVENNKKDRNVVNKDLIINEHLISNEGNNSNSDNETLLQLNDEKSKNEKKSAEIKNEKQNVKTKSFTNINTKSFIVVVSILFGILILAGILTYFIPQGNFALNDAGEIIPGTFVEGAVVGMPIWRFFTAPFEVFASPDGLTLIFISLFLLIMSGTFNIMEKTNGVKVIINKAVKKFSSKKTILVGILILIFMAYGSFFGMFEELVALMPLVIILMISLGFDTLTGMGISLLAACFGFASAITNPFSVGLASSIAKVPVTSGIGLRILMFVLVFALVFGFLYLHIRKIKKNPEKSLTYKMDEEKRKQLFVNKETIEKENKIFWTYAIFFIIQVAIILLISIIPAISGFSVPILCFTFLVGGIICGLSVNKNFKQIINFFLKGAASMLPAILMIALAGAIKFVMTESQILFTVMNSIIGVLQNQNPFVCLVLIYLLILFLQIFIGSASAKVILIMPIILPICMAVGIPPSLAIITYCMADGFTDVILPTNPVLLVGLSMAGVSYGKWFKWTWLLQVAAFVLTLGILGLGVLTI